MLPRTLDGNRIQCLSMAVNQSIIPLSNATIQVLKDDILPIRTYVEITTPNGVTEIYRTRQPQTVHGSDTATIQLDHAICEIGDYLIQDAIQEETTVADAFDKIFDHYRGTDWQLGTILANESVTLDCDYDNVLETLLSILEQVPQYYMTFDFTTTPWTLGIAEKEYTVTAEGRLSRNIESAIVKYDDKDQCTRVYVKGLPKPSGRESDENAIGYMDADAATIAEYGIIEKETGSGNLTQAQATRIATAYLDEHKLPKKSVEINGYDLSDITGESLDSFVCGKYFRLAIPDDSTVIEDFITKVSFQDVINSDACNVIIGEEQDTAINFLQEQASSTKSSRSASKKQQKLDDQFVKNFEETDEYGAILLQAGMKLDAHGMIVYARDNANNIGSILDFTSSQIMTQVEAGDLGLQSAIYQTASAIRLEVNDSLCDVHSEITQTADQIYSSVWGANSSVYSQLLMTSTQIYSHVGDVESGLHSEINQTAGEIYSSVWGSESSMYSFVQQTASGINQTVANTANGLQSSINQQAGRIDLLVEGTGSNQHIKPAQIQAAINADSQSQIKISANKVMLDGNTSLSGKMTLNNGNLIVNGTSYFDSIHINSGNSLTFDYGSGPAYSPVTLNASTLQHMIIKAEKDDTTDIVTLTPLNGEPITFRKAAPGGNKISGSWSGNTYTAVASMDGAEFASTTPRVHPIVPATLDTYATIKIGELNNGSWTDHDGDTWLYLVNNGRTVRLNSQNQYSGSGTFTYAQLTIPEATVTGSWSSNTYTAESSLGGSVDVTPRVHPIVGTDAYARVKIGVLNNGSWIDHDGDTFLYLVLDNNTIYLNNQNSASGTGVLSYARKSVQSVWDNGFVAGAPTAATLGSKVTGTVWNVSIARGEYSPVAKTIDLTSAYSDARNGYYTQQEYNTNWTTGFNAGAPTAVTLGSKVTGAVWNVSVARGSYSAVAKTIDLSNAYSDARSGYYTKAQYDANKITGWDACWNTFSSDGTTATKTLAYGETATVVVKQTSSSGTVTSRLSRTYTAPADRTITASAGGWVSDGENAAHNTVTVYRDGAAYTSATVYSSGASVGYLESYSPSPKRYSFISGAGTANAVTQMGWRVNFDGTYRDIIVTSNAPTTNAYRDGFAAGKAAGGGGTTYANSLTFRCDSVQAGSTYTIKMTATPGATLGSKFKKDKTYTMHWNW